MIWSEVRQAYPDCWLIIEALEAHTAREELGSREQRRISPWMLGAAT